VENKILDAAVALFGIQQFHEVRMEDIAARAKVGKGTLYRYFGDKDALFHALIERASREYRERLRRAAGCGGSARETLRRIVGMILVFWDERPQVLNLIQRSEVLRGAFPWAEERSETIRLFGQAMRAGTAQGEFAVDHPETAALLLAGGLRFLVLAGPRPRPVDLADRVLDAMLRPAPAVSAGPNARAAEDVSR
jgi:AcrR family transcriptional regulator